MARRLQDLDPWLIDSLMIPATLHDVDGVFVRVNAAAERASGITNEEWAGRRLTDRVLPEVRADVEAQFRRVVDTGEPTDFVTLFVDATETKRGVRVQQLPLSFGGEVVGVLTLAFAFGPEMPEPVVSERTPHLTPRQREILELIDVGLSTAEIAERLTLSRETVRNHVRNLLAELSAHTRAEAIAAARRRGLLASPALPPATEG